MLPLYAWVFRGFSLSKSMASEKTQWLYRSSHTWQSLHPIEPEDGCPKMSLAGHKVWGTASLELRQVLFRFNEILRVYYTLNVTLACLKQNDHKMCLISFLTGQGGQILAALNLEKLAAEGFQFHSSQGISAKRCFLISCGSPFWQPTMEVSGIQEGYV